MCRKEKKRKKNRKQAKKVSSTAKKKNSSSSTFISKLSTKFLRSMLDTSLLSSSPLIRLLFVGCQKKKENDCYMSTVSSLDESLFSFIAYCVCILEPISFAYCLCKFDEINRDSRKVDQKKDITSC
jgi:hypothetical protein